MVTSFSGELRSLLCLPQINKCYYYELAAILLILYRSPQILRNDYGILVYLCIYWVTFDGILQYISQQDGTNHTAAF